MDACNVLFLANEGFDYLSSQLIEGLWLLDKAEKIIFRCTQANTHHGAQVGDLEALSMSDAHDCLGWADFVLFSSGGNMSALGDDFNDRSLAKKRIFIDGHDSNALLSNPLDHLVYFKREMRLPRCNYFSMPNVRSITFGVYQYLLDDLSSMDDLYAEWDSRDIDVCFMAFGGSNVMRQQCLDVLWESDFETEVHVSDDNQPVDQDRYHDILHRSKVGISIIGAGLDTLRFWETPAHGAVLCSMDLSVLLQMRNPFEANRHCLYFSNWPMMLELLGLVVSNMDRWIHMRRAADRCLPFHSTKHRAEELIEICQEMV